MTAIFLGLFSAAASNDSGAWSPSRAALPSRRVTVAAPLRLLVFDATCRGTGVLPGLSHAWSAGSLLYRGLSRLDRARGVADFAEALSWLAEVEPGRSIGEIQLWGHGKWGELRLGAERLDLEAFARRHPHHASLAKVRARLAGPEALVWLRTCETFGAAAGLRFAGALTDFFGCRAAGHTYVIGAWQSGLHRLEPGHAPDWSATEGLCEGTASVPVRALASSPVAPNTITFLDGAIPDGF